MISRRGILFGLGATLAAPAIVRADSLMKLFVPKRYLRVVTAPYSLVIPSSATLGSTSATTYRLWVIKEGGNLTFRAELAPDHVPVGYFEATDATAGTWADMPEPNPIRNHIITGDLS